MVKNTLQTLAFLAFTVAMANAQNNTQPNLPLHIPQHYIFPLRSLENCDLQDQLANKLNANPKWKKLISQKKLAVGLVDLSDPYNVRFAQVNGLTACERQVGLADECAAGACNGPGRDRGATGHEFALLLIGQQASDV